MSQFKEIFKRLDTNELATIERRTFLRNTLLTGITLSPLSMLFQKAHAQLTDEEIVVWGDDTDYELVVKKIHAQKAASYLRDIALGVSGFGAGLIGIGLAGAEFSAGLTLLIVIDGMGFIVGGAALLFAAFMLDYIAADPPRENYQIENLLQGTIHTSKLLSESKNLSLNKLILNSSDLAAATRRTWDSLELWQGAKQAQDVKWMTTHAQNFRGSIDEMAKGLRLLPANLRAAIQNYTEATADPEYKTIVNETKSLSGQRLSDIAAIKEVLQEGVNWNAEILEGQQDQLRKELNDLIVQPFDEQAFQKNLRNLREEARYFESL